MSKQLTENGGTGGEAQNQEPIEVREFFERVPPGKCVQVKGMPRSRASAPPNAFTIERLKEFVLPDIELHCPTEKTCDGVRTFAPHTEFSLDPGQDLFAFIEYSCRNCRRSAKVFAIQATRPHGRDVALVCKFGERPPFGPPLPSKLIELIRPEWDYFQKGRRSENQGLGIGAFGYYRRVIESQRNRIFDEVIKAATKLNARPETIKELASAKNEKQFKKALESVTSGLPETLLIDGQNPLLLLHDALSEGLHAESDEECLQAASDIRVVMAELAERLSQVLKNDAEIESAVSRLLARRSSRTDSPGRT